MGKDSLFSAEAEFQATLQKALVAVQQWISEGDVDREAENKKAIN